MSDAQTHMAWCKHRALQYLDAGDVGGALASFASDVRKDEATADRVPHDLLAMEGMRLAVANDAAGLRRFLEGFPD